MCAVSQTRGNWGGGGVVVQFGGMLHHAGLG